MGIVIQGTWICTHERKRDNTMPGMSMQVTDVIANNVPKRQVCCPEFKNDKPIHAI